MAVKTEPVENAPSKTENAPSDKDIRIQLKLARADFAELKKKHEAMDTNFKRAQKKIAKLEAEKPPKEPEPHSAPESNATASVAPSTIASQTPTINAPSTPSKKNRSWPLPYCPGPEWCGDPEHHSKGAKNSEFKDEVECVDCHAPLGPEKDVRHEMESCPFCSSDRGYVARPGYEMKHDRCEGPNCKVKA